jgi:hypothetical protein
MIEIDKIGKSSPSKVGMHSPEDASFFPNLAVQKVHLKISLTTLQSSGGLGIEELEEIMHSDSNIQSVLMFKGITTGNHK